MVHYLVFTLTDLKTSSQTQRHLPDNRFDTNEHSPTGINGIFQNQDCPVQQRIPDTAFYQVQPNYESPKPIGISTVLIAESYS